ncbi:MAG: hypothetical protein V3R55_05260, partial [Alphaproteobacteria bacterium]
ALEEARVSGWKRFLIYNAVRSFGGGAYRREDEPRYVKEEEEAGAVAPSTGEAEASDINTDPQS